MRPAIVGILLVAAAPARADKVDDLVQLLRAGPSHRVRTEAALVLGRVGDARAIGPLGDALRDPEPAVRGAAASALGRVGDARAVAQLEALARDPSEFVRESAARASARLSGRASVPSGARFLVTLRLAGPPEATKVLGDALVTEVGRLPLVAPVPPGSDAPPLGTMSAFELDGSITRLAVAGGQLDCDVRVAFTALPAHAIRATYSGGASITNVKGEGDRVAQRACLSGAAQQIAEEFGTFLKTQKQ